MKALGFAALAAAVVVGGAASAATINFNVNSNWTYGSRTFTTGANSVSVEAFTYGNATHPTLQGNPALASWSGSSGGLGICSDLRSNSTGTNDSDRCRESHQVDGSGSNEMAVLNFGTRVVQLTSITFASAYSTGSNGGDQFDLFTFGNGTGAQATGSLLDRPVTCSGGVCTANLTSFGLVGSIFGVGAYDWDSAFKIRSISFEDAPSVVPLPAAGWALLAGIGALAAVKRRRKAA